jgi:NADPH2:quinone reductase
VVEAIGEGVTDVAVGDRVVYAGTVLGSYATIRAIDAEQLVKLPDAIDGKTAAAAFLKGLTADMLVGACGKVQPGQTILVHAAAGGMGSLLVQWVHALGATVIAHAGNAEKAEKARALGADHVLSGPFDALAGEVRRLTNGRGVDTVFDGVGKASWDASLASIAKRGLMVTYGNASGPVPALPPLDLMRAGSLFLTRPTMGDYFDGPADRRTAAKRLFDMILSGKLRIEIGQTFALADAAQAHRALEARQTTGSTVLLP